MNHHHKSLWLALVIGIGITTAASAHNPTTRQREGVINIRQRADAQL